MNRKKVSLPRRHKTVGICALFRSVRALETGQNDAKLRVVWDDQLPGRGLENLAQGFNPGR
jgi:hypothetical protein